MRFSEIIDIHPCQGAASLISLTSLAMEQEAIALKVLNADGVEISYKQLHKNLLRLIEMVKSDPKHPYRLLCGIGYNHKRLYSCLDRIGGLPFNLCLPAGVASKVEVQRIICDEVSLSDIEQKQIGKTARQVLLSSTQRFVESAKAAGYFARQLDDKASSELLRRHHAYHSANVYVSNNRNLEYIELASAYGLNVI